MHDNENDANVYSYPFITFKKQKKQEIRVGDIVTVFNNEEVPADIVLINVDSGSAYFDTVMLDGEPVLSERFSFVENVTSVQLQAFRGLITCEDPNPVVHSFRGAISINNE